MATSYNPDEFFSVDDFAKRHPKHIKSVSALRWHVCQRRINGMEKAGAIVRTATGHLRIHEPSFFAWWLGADRSSRRRAA